MPEDDPNKPKSWLSEQVARATASVATEVATSFGHEVSFIVSDIYFYGLSTKMKEFSHILSMFT